MAAGGGGGAPHMGNIIWLGSMVLLLVRLLLRICISSRWWIKGGINPPNPLLAFRLSPSQKRRTEIDEMMMMMSI